MLRDMEVGDRLTVKLPDAKACDSGKVTAYQLQNHLGCKFSMETDYAKCELTITKHNSPTG